MHYEKLVRDNIPEILDGKGIAYEVREADDAEYKHELIKKLLEEAQEFATDPSIEELADVSEVLDALRKLPEYIDLPQVQSFKRSERGRFAKRLIVKGEK